MRSNGQSPISAWVALLCPVLLSGCGVAANEAINLGGQIIGEPIIRAVENSFTQPDKHAAPQKLETSKEDDSVVTCHLSDSADLNISVSVCMSRGGSVQ